MFCCGVVGAVTGLVFSGLSPRYQRELGSVGLILPMFHTIHNKKPVSFLREGALGLFLMAT